MLADCAAILRCSGEILLGIRCVRRPLVSLNGRHYPLLDHWDKRQGDDVGTIGIQSVISGKMSSYWPTLAI